MASILSYCSLLLITWTFTIIAKPAAAAAGIFRPSQWSLAHATFYGDETAFATMGGACGYGNLLANGYGTDTVALSSTLFNNGYGCGTCYQIKCYQSSACYENVPFITVTATNLCPPNWDEASENGGWCNPPRAHFDMSKPAFMKIANWKSGIVPVMYRRVPCMRSGGIRFSLEGNGYWLLVYVMNVGGGGDIGGMWVKGRRTGWISMTHNWGAFYQAFASLAAQPISFKITTYSTRDTVIAWNVVPPNWAPGMSYSTDLNFHRIPISKLSMLFFDFIFSF